MNAKRIFYIMTGGIGLLLLLAITGAVLGDLLLRQQTDHLVALKLENYVLDAQQASLNQAKQDIIKYDALNKIARVIVPQDKNQALTVRELTTYAKQAGIRIGGITFPDSNLGQAKISPSTTQLMLVKDIPGVYQLPITIQSDTANPVSFPQLVSFLQLLEKNRHTAQVNQLTITPADSTGTRLSFVLVINVYIKP